MIHDIFYIAFYLSSKSLYISYYRMRYQKSHVMIFILFTYRKYHRNDKKHLVINDYCQQITLCCYISSLINFPENFAPAVFIQS